MLLSVSRPACTESVDGLACAPAGNGAVSRGGRAALQVFRSTPASRAAATRARGGTRGVQPAAHAQARVRGARGERKTTACSTPLMRLEHAPRGGLMRAWLSTRACVGHAASQRPRDARRAAPLQGRGMAPRHNSRGLGLRASATRPQRAARAARVRTWVEVAAASTAATASSLITADGRVPIWPQCPSLPRRSTRRDATRRLPEQAAAHAPDKLRYSSLKRDAYVARLRRQVIDRPGHDASCTSLRLFHAVSLLRSAP